MTSSLASPAQITDMGSATFVAGVKLVNSTRVTATSKIFAFCTTVGGTIASLYEDGALRVPGTSFTIKSLNVLDTSTFVWIVI